MIEFGDFNWRDAVLVAAVLIGIYLVLLVARLFQMSSRRGAATAEPLVDEMPELAEMSELPDAAPEFARELQRSNLEVEISQLRREGQDLRQQLAAMHEEIRRLKSASSVSPMYSEAMALAQHGQPASVIADRCDISLAEAELVAAMARGQAEDETYIQTEGRDDYRHRNF